MTSYEPRTGLTDKASIPFTDQKELCPVNLNSRTRCETVAQQVPQLQNSHLGKRLNGRCILRDKGLLVAVEDQQTVGMFDNEELSHHPGHSPSRRNEQKE